MNKSFSRSRRSLLQGSALGLAALAGAAIPLRLTAADEKAQGLPHLAEDDPSAKALKYVHDATKSPDRKDANAFCHNCRYFKPKKPSDPWGPCDLFPGKAVNTNGWCSVWVKKA